MDEFDCLDWHRCNRALVADQLNLLMEFVQMMRRGEQPTIKVLHHVDTSLQAAYARKFLPSLNVEPLLQWHAAALDWFHNSKVPEDINAIFVGARHALLEILNESRLREQRSAPSKAAAPPKGTPKRLTSEDRATEIAAVLLGHHFDGVELDWREVKPLDLHGIRQRMMKPGKPAAGLSEPNISKALKLIFKGGGKEYKLIAKDKRRAGDLKRILSANIL